MTIASDYGDAREVQRLIRDEVERAGFDADSQFAIKLALEEALINAIKHGNKLDKRKLVQVEWRVSPAAVEITKLNKLFKILPTRAEALASYN